MWVLLNGDPSGLLRFTGCGVYFVFGNKCGYKWPQPTTPVWTDVLAVCPGHGLLKSMYGLTCMFENNICMVGTHILSGPSSLHIPGWQLPPIRAILLCILSTCLGATWLVEQPASSRLVWYPRWERFLASAWMKVFRVGWWSRHYGALSPILSLILIKSFIFLTFSQQVF